MGEVGLATRRFPTPQSLATYGRHLTNFIEWCDARRKSWTALEYAVDIVEGYPADMLAGRWSAAGVELSKKTVNNRVGEACTFLLWAVARSLRPPFKILSYKQSYVSETAVSSIGHEQRDTQARVGRVRPDPMRLTLPESAVVMQWMKSVAVERGATKALMCELILRTGIRREECVQWRLTTLPKTRSDWQQRGRMVTVTVEYGAKGQKTKDAYGDEKGPARDIELPVELAERLHEYATITRATQRKRYVDLANSAADRRNRFNENPRQLFLSDSTCEPVSAASLYKAWTSVSGMFKRWSPHLGRHYWACHTLIEETRVQQQIVRAGASALPTSWIYGTAQDILLMKLQPQLGHISKETSLTYVRWVCRAMGMDVEADDWYLCQLESATCAETARPSRARRNKRIAHHAAYI